jgi:ubiquinone/menaquinone biosynthesis C-methylase UbiE
MDYENEFDIIFSWETFEHIMNPKEALARIYKALKPGGIVFSQYNPFFCLSGGHSMCTLDFPFAHTLLTDEDFKRYVETIVPENAPPKYSELSYNFFTKNLNRMTQNDLTKYINDIGFELVNFMSMPDLSLLNVIDDSTLDSAKTIHPTLTLNDLLCSSVYFIGRK